MIKILNLYCGIGGNRKLWDSEEVEVTAVEINPSIAKVYQDLYPNDKVIIGDAHQYLLEHFEEFDFIWTSPPCPTHSKVRRTNPKQNKPIFPDMKLYEEILLLEGYFKGKWVVENVISWYEPLKKPFIYKEHYYWSNFIITGSERAYRGMNTKEESIELLQRLKGFDLSKYTFKGISKIKVLRNCVEPKAGLEIFKSAFKDQQQTLSNQFAYNGE